MHHDLQPFEVSVVVAATPAAVYHAWIDPAQLSRWFLPGDTWRVAVDDIEIEVRPGGRFSVPLVDPRGTTYPSHFDSIRELADGERIVFGAEGADAVVTLSPTLRGTRVTLATATDEGSTDHLAAGWELVLERLAAAMSGRPAAALLAAA